MQEELTGAAFHPLDDNLMITHGKGHLTFWNRRKDGFFERTDIIKPVSIQLVHYIFVLALECFSQFSQANSTLPKLSSPLSTNVSSHKLRINIEFDDKQHFPIFTRCQKNVLFH